MQKSQDILPTLPLFSGLSKADLRKVQSLMTTITVEEGRTFIEEGKPGREAFVILSGRGTVRRGAKVVASVGPGDVIGEAAVLANVPRSASITADTEMTVEVLNRREFVSLLEEFPKILMKVAISAIKHAAELEASVTG